MKKYELILAVLFLFSLGGTTWFLMEESEALLIRNSQQNAESLSRALQKFRELYTSEVVNRANSEGIEATHDYLTRDGTIPLPATLTKLLGEHIGELGYGETVKLYSDFPFPWRHNELELDRFEKQALSFLRQNPDTSYSSVDVVNGVKIFRYATADVMKESCVTCHNTHPNSPKTDWKVGDTRGILEISFPIANLTSLAREELNDIIFLIAAYVGGIFCLLSWFMARLRRQKEILAQTVVERTHELEKTGRFFRSVVDNAVEGIITIDTHGTIRDFNDAASSIFGYSQHEVVGKKINMLMPEPHSSHHDQYLDNYLRTGEQKIIGSGREAEGLRKDGTKFPASLAVSKVEVDDEIFFTGLVQDITDRKNAEDTIRKMAHYDILTGIPNRALFNERLHHSIAVANRNNTQFALLFIDLDGFKKVNDTLGHRAGDLLLIQVSERILGGLRETDAAGRLGGDEFAVILTDIKEKEDVIKKADDLIEKIAQPYLEIDESCRIGCSIGIAMFPDDANNNDELLGKADHAMYRVKNEGKNSFRFYERGE